MDLLKDLSRDIDFLFRLNFRPNLDQFVAVVVVAVVVIVVAVVVVIVFVA